MEVFGNVLILVLININETILLPILALFNGLKNGTAQGAFRKRAAVE